MQRPERLTGYSRDLSAPPDPDRHVPLFAMERRDEARVRHPEALQLADYAVLQLLWPVARRAKESFSASPIRRSRTFASRLPTRPCVCQMTPASAAWRKLDPHRQAPPRHALAVLALQPRDQLQSALHLVQTLRDPRPPGFKPMAHLRRQIPPAPTPWCSSVSACGAYSWE